MIVPLLCVEVVGTESFLGSEDHTFESARAGARGGEKEAAVAYSYVSQIRDLGFSAQLYPLALKINKQMSYANQIDSKLVVMIGEDEVSDNMLTVKNMSTGKQESLEFSELINMLKKK